MKLLQYSWPNFFNNNNYYKQPTETAIAILKRELNKKPYTNLALVPPGSFIPIFLAENAPYVQTEIRNKFQTLDVKTGALKTAKPLNIYL